ncbi:20300_t:CDS:2 [Dentiscutata erythropus]|uniref:20300_t:CDS:1 n=1 Tax=Dentiscutata erythropus TaxID=1348616 RepID=A0A9N8YTL6_9GLOM|nr:20300_t:CDS:2 [Dentiscutata erythropus]
MKILIIKLQPKIKATIYLKIQCNIAIDKLNELYQIEQAVIIEESNDDLFVSSSGSLVINEPSSINQVNYSLLEIYEDSDDENNLSDEVVRYLALSKISPNYNYLAIPATSVPSERLFSDTGLHLSACHICLKSKFLASILFLKRNMKLFDVFDK